MIEAFLRPEALPFSLALTVVAGLFLLEIITMLLGGTLLALGADSPDIDMDVDLDTDFDLDLDIDVETDINLPATPPGFLGWIGINNVPFMIWFVAFLTVFGLSGLVLQSILFTIFGAALQGSLASLISLVPGLFGARFIASIIAVIMPKTETTAMSTRFLGGYHGVITQGIAKRGKPAEAKIKDYHGNTHYLRVEPLDDGAEITQGSDVHIIRKRNGTFFAVDLS